MAKWLVGGRNSLLINGSVGAGKTTMCRALCHLMGRIGGYHCCRMGRAADIMRRCDGDDYYLWRDADALFIDDFGTESVEAKSYGNVTTPLLDILYHRYERLSTTVITSNLSVETIGGRYGERLADRMRECYDVITLSQGSYRR